MDSLPLEIRLQILSYLSGEELNQLKLLNKFYAQFLNDYKESLPKVEISMTIERNDVKTTHLEELEDALRSVFEECGDSFRRISMEEADFSRMEKKSFIFRLPNDSAILELENSVPASWTNLIKSNLGYSVRSFSKIIAHIDPFPSLYSTISSAAILFTDDRKELLRSLQFSFKCDSLVRLSWKVLLKQIRIEKSLEKECEVSMVGEIVEKPSETFFHLENEETELQGRMIRFMDGDELRVFIRKIKENVFLSFE